VTIAYYSAGLLQGQSLSAPRELLSFALDINEHRLLSNSVTRGSCLKLVKTTCSSDIRKYFFTSRVVDDWNCLNDDIVKSPISVLKKRLSGVKFDRFLTVTD